MTNRIVTTVTESAAVAESATVVEPGLTRAVEADAKTGKTLLKLISPGWGSKAYYSSRMLAESGPAAFPKGTHTFWDHPTKSSAVDHPERTLTRLAGVLLEAAHWEDNGPLGPGLYAEAMVQSAFAPALFEIADHIGCSIRAVMEAERGQIEGRSGLIATRLVPSPHNSVDYVTVPGAGGYVVQVYESALPDVDQVEEADQADWRGDLKAAVELWAESADGQLPEIAEAANLAHWLEARIHLGFTQHADYMFGDGKLTREERKGLSAAISAALDSFAATLEETQPQLLTRSPWESVDSATLADESEDGNEQETGQMETTQTTETDKVAALQARLNASEARTLAADAVADSSLPALAHRRVIESALLVVPVTEAGDLDQPALLKQVAAAIEAEQKYIAGIAGRKPTGAGVLTAETDDEVDTTKLQESLVQQFMSEGMSEASARAAAAI